MPVNVPTPDTAVPPDWEAITKFAFEAGRLSVGSKRVLRSRRGCLTCRRRKVKCNEMGPICSRCKVAKRDCTWDSDSEWFSSGEQITEAPTGSGSTNIPMAPQDPAGGVRDPTDLETSTSPETRITHASDNHSPADVEVFTSAPVVHNSASDWNIGGSNQMDFWSFPPDSDANLIGGFSQDQLAFTDPHVSFDFLLPFALGETGAPVDAFGHSLPVPAVGNMSDPMSTHRQAQSLPAATNPSAAPRDLASRSTSPAIEPAARMFEDSTSQELFRFFASETTKLLAAMANGQTRRNPMLAMCIRLLNINSSSAPVCCSQVRRTKCFGRSQELPPTKEPANSTDLKSRALHNLYMGLETEVDLIRSHPELPLAVVVFLTSRDMIDTDRTWRQTQQIAVSFILHQGGIERMLEKTGASPDLRMLLENIAGHEVFGTFTTGCEALLLDAWAPWMLEIASSETNTDFDSVQHAFGMSRTTLDMIGKASSLAIRCSGALMTGRRAYSGNAALQHLHKAASDLWLELEILETVSTGHSNKPSRVQNGDRIYIATMKLFLTAEVDPLELRSGDRQQLVDLVLELCGLTADQPIHLAWPLLVVSREVGIDDRSRIRDLCSTFSSRYGGTMALVIQLIERQWRDDDQGKIRPTWVQFLREAGAVCLLM